jgi:COP9 signalosome complex subunit 1
MQASVAEVHAVGGRTHTQVIAPEDVALYGALCALATFERDELKRRLVDSINFKGFLDLVPQVGPPRQQTAASRDVLALPLACHPWPLPLAVRVWQVRELVYDFVNSRYGSCLKYLGELQPELMLDLHLHKHVQALYKKIRDRCLLQVGRPVRSCSMTLPPARWPCIAY